MLESFAGQIASSGVLGAILVVLGYAYWKQGEALAAAQAARVADAQRVASTLLEMQAEWLGAINELTEAVRVLSERTTQRKGGPGVQ